MRLHNHMIFQRRLQAVKLSDDALLQLERDDDAVKLSDALLELRDVISSRLRSRMRVRFDGVEAIRRMRKA